MTLDSWNALKRGELVRGRLGDYEVLKVHKWASPDGRRRGVPKGPNTLDLKSVGDGQLPPIKGAISFQGFERITLEPVPEALQTSAIPEPEQAEGARLYKDGELLGVPLADLTPSPTNPRKRFDEKGLAELAESIRSKGVLQPLVVRPLAKGFEVVAGERRFRAAAIAGVTSVPCIIRHLSSLEVLEVQVIENNQREDVHPLEECEGFRRLIDSGAYGSGQAAVKTLAEKLGKSESYVYSRLRYAALTKEAKDEFLAGNLTAGHADLLMRLGPKDQREAITVLLWQHDYQNKRASSRHHDPPALSVREFDRWIDREIRKPLASAPWDKADPDLLSAAGSCSGCMKNTAYDGSLFGDDLKAGAKCLDSVCFAAKLQAHTDRVLEEVRREHPEARIGVRGYGQIPKGAVATSTAVKAKEGDPGAVPVVLADAFDMSQIGSVAWYKVDPPSKQESAEVEAKQREEERLAQHEMKVERAFRKRLLEAVSCVHPAEVTDAMLRELARTAIQPLYQSMLERILAMQGWPKESVHSQTILKRLPDMNTAQLVPLLLQLMLVREIEVDRYSVKQKPERLLGMAKALEIDVIELRREAEASLAKKKTKEVQALPAPQKSGGQS